MEPRSLATRAGITLVGTAAIAAGIWATIGNGRASASRSAEREGLSQTSTHERRMPTADEGDISRRVAVLERQLALANARLAQTDKKVVAELAESPEPPRTPQQARFAAEARDREYEQRFAVMMTAEPVDERRTSETLVRVRETLSEQSLAGVSVNAVECKPSVCKISVGYGNDAELSDRVQQKLAGLLTEGMAAWFHPQDTGELSAYIVSAEKAPFRVASGGGARETASSPASGQ